VKATIPWPPSVNDYWHHTRSGHTYLSPQAKAFKLGVALKLRAKGHRQPLTGPVVVHLWAFRPRRRGDLDNVLKAVLDALKGTAFADDDQVVELHARRCDDALMPRVELEVVPDQEAEA
jgi:crossover junction endodeoxyribonuclease RusA